MLCCVCKKNRAEKICDINSDGQTVREYFCTECYRRRAESAKRQAGADGGENTPEREEINRSVSADKGGERQKARCPFCGTTVVGYESARLFGCPECYRYLFEFIKNDVVLMQGDEPHAGKKPQNAAGTVAAAATAGAKEKGRRV